MPIKHLVTPGVGFSPGSIKYIVTRGLIPQVYTQPPVAVALNLKRRTTALTVPVWNRGICNTTQKQVFVAPSEGFTLTVDTTNYATPTAAAVTVYDRHNRRITSNFVPSGGASIASNVVTLPELSIPATANGEYRVDVSVEASGYSPAIVRIPLFVSKQHQWLTVIEGIQKLRRGEGVALAIATTAWGGSPTSPSVTITRWRDSEDVTAVLMPNGSHSVDGDNVVLKELAIPATAEVGEYRVDVQFNASGFTPAVAHFIVGVGI